MKYISDLTRLKSWLLVWILLIIVAVYFYWLQNSGQLEGGKIALPKLIWLVYAIVLWFLIPAFIIKDRQVLEHWKTIFRIFLINMLLRGVVELYLMYVTVSWSPYYGIFHDVFSIVLLISLLLWFRGNIQKDLYFGYAGVVLITLIIEIGFVFYMIRNVSGNVDSVYFVPNDPSHSVILSITWVVVGLLTIYLFEFSRRLLRGRVVGPGRKV
ncbi:MAG: hypothetical protein V3V18_08530 [Methylococcales bacterium]